MTTTAHKIAHLEQYGFTVGERDARLNTAYPGTFMIAEATRETISDFELPTEDGANGPWCVVGDDLDALVGEAHDHLLGLADDHNGIASAWNILSGTPAEALPPRRSTPLDAFIARSTYADIYLERKTGRILRIDYEAMGGKDEWDDVSHFDPATLTDPIGEDDVMNLRCYGKDGTVYDPVPNEPEADEPQTDPQP